MNKNGNGQEQPEARDLETLSVRVPREVADQIKATGHTASELLRIGLEYSFRIHYKTEMVKNQAEEAKVRAELIARIQMLCAQAEEAMQSGDIVKFDKYTQLMSALAGTYNGLVSQERHQ